MIRARGGFREITALVMLLTWIVGNEVAARPPVKQLPAGYEEWRATGVHPKILEPHAERGGGKAIFPTPRGDIATFYLSFNTPEKSRALLRCVAEREDTIPLESSLATGAMGYKFNVRQGEVIPLYGHLYAIDAVAGPVFVRLTRVTERVPEDLRPIKNSRLIATTTVRPELFWQQDAARRDRRDYDEVRFLKLDKDTRRATIELLPGFVSWKSYGPKSASAISSARVGGPTAC